MARSIAAAPRASWSISARLAESPLPGNDRHRPHPLGDARRADRGQCPSAHRRRRLHRPQRHHRELQAAARRADRRGPRVQEPDRHRSRRASRHRELERGHQRRGRSRRGAAAAARRVRVAFLFRNQPDLLICARLGAPLTVGYGEGENYLGSDAHALPPLTQRIAYLDEGDWACSPATAIEDLRSRQQSRHAPDRRLGRDRRADRQGQSPHFMLKEIYEQPVVVAQTLARTSARSSRRSRCPTWSFDLSKIERVAIVACGTAPMSA
jgi:hypothetical protein